MFIYWRRLPGPKQKLGREENSELFYKWHCNRKKKLTPYGYVAMITWLQTTNT